MKVKLTRFSLFSARKHFALFSSENYNKQLKNGPFNVILGVQAPPKWRGTLDVKYNLGPGFDGDITVSMNVSNYYEVKSIYNVIGTMYGSVEPDRIVLIGNHRDSWVNGAVDASTGTTVTTEIARGLGELKDAGWKPRRTIKVQTNLV